jgi:hypothetical protein
MAAQKQEVIDHVSGSPAKNFFVNMLTRDIELHDAILDLLDNCVDGAWRVLNEKKHGSESLKGYWAKIELKPEKFTIEDNCGGIPWSIAKEYAFKMGKPKENEKAEGTIGMVGIGMKRAIFKMGRECLVHSHHPKDSFLVTIPSSWFNADDQNWDFPAARENPISSNYGTVIEILKLEASAKIAFQKGSHFRASFEAQIGESYSYLIDKGFEITVNGEPIKRKPLKIIFENPSNKAKWGGLIQPYIFQGKHGDVDIFFAVGYRSAMRTQEEIDSDTDGSFAAKDAGWTVVCNDRVVLSNDKSVLTGWDFGGVPGFHTQFSSIAGVVEFSSKNTFDLPLTTTKRGLDSGEEIYTIIRSRMQEATKHFTRHTNRWKGREHELKNYFRKLHDDGEEYDLKDLKTIAKKVKFGASSNMPGFKLYKPDLPLKTHESNDRRISFYKSISDINSLSQYLFDEERAPSDVGEACFDRVFKEAAKNKK